MINAFMMMKCIGKTHKRYISANQYEKLKSEFSKIMSENQTGSKNSQYNTKWVNKGLITKKISINDLNYYLNNGWKIGRVEVTQKSINKIVKNLEKEEKRNLYIKAKIKEYTAYHNVYIKYGFEEVVKQFNYKFTKQNLVIGFAKYVKEFIPQNGKRRKIK